VVTIKEKVMSNRVKNIISQFVQLTPSEQQEFIHILSTKTDDSKGGVKHRGGNIFGNKMGSTTINFAPTPGVCPRCGK